MLLVLLARMVQTWKQAHITRSARDTPTMASPGIQALLEIQVQRSLCHTKDLPRDYLLDQGDGNQQSTVGSRTHPWRITQGFSLHVSKRTIQKYMRSVRQASPGGQKWNTFLHTHAEQIWACDFLSVTDLFFRSLFAFFIVELHSHRVIHVGVTPNPTDTWTARTSSGSDRLWCGTEVPHP